MASAAWSDTYAGLLRAETIVAFLRSAYSPERLVTRITSNHLYVALDDGPVVAFADARVLPERIALEAIYALPQLRTHGAGTALLEALFAALPPLPMTADVVAGNRKGEIFYERRGFVPRETLPADLFGEAVVERRWWRDRPEQRDDDD
ncbi:MAG: GNAT family N-acetyltransferase [Chloroflexota bacterium]|nr:GNAT family N-acetyltransferase [Chloroflexota bacterium]